MVPYMPISSISHNNGVVINLENEPIYEYENFPNDDEGGVGGLNYTSCIYKIICDSKCILQVPKS